MKIKTSELKDKALDWAVAKAIGEYRPVPVSSYSTDWSQGGPIMDREKISVVCAEGDYNPSKAGTSECYDTYWVADIGKLSASTVYGPQSDDWGSHFQIDADAMQGPTPLIAAMRCFVASKLGDEVEIPEELVT